MRARLWCGRSRTLTSPRSSKTRRVASDKGEGQWFWFEIFLSYSSTQPFSSLTTFPTIFMYWNPTRKNNEIKHMLSNPILEIFFSPQKIRPLTHMRKTTQQTHTCTFENSSTFLVLCLSRSLIIMIATGHVCAQTTALVASVSCVALGGLCLLSWPPKTSSISDQRNQ